MTDEQKQELKQEIEVINEILTYARESFKIAEYLFTPDEDGEKNYSKRMLVFFYYDARIHWRTCVIELSKLFSGKKGDIYNLEKFIRKLSRDGVFAYANIPQSQLDQWMLLINNERAVITNLLEQRDKLYAHTDRDSKEVVNTLSLNKTKELIAIAHKIIREIYDGVYNLSIMENSLITAPSQGVEYVVNCVADIMKQRKEAWRLIAKEHDLEGEL